MPDEKRLEEIRLTLRRIGLIRGKEFDTKAQKIWDLAQDLLDVSDALRAELKAAREKALPKIGALVDAALQILHHDRDDNDPEVAYERNELRERFSKVLRIKSAP